MTQNARDVRQTIYNLKRHFGIAANLVNRTSSVVNRETGTKEVTLDSRRITRAIVMNEQIDRKFVYNLTFIASNKDFTYGALFDQRMRVIILDFQDLGPFIPKVGQYLVTEDSRYDIESVQRHPEYSLYILTGKATVNEALENLIFKNLYHYLPVTDSVSWSK